MRIVIVGPGALGSLVAARLALLNIKGRGAENGNETLDVSLLDYRQERARQIRQSGLLIEEKGQSVRCHVQVVTEPEICAGCDVLFLCVKAASVDHVLQRITPHILPETLFLAMENGIGHIEAVRQLPCLAGVGITSEGATLIAPGHVRHGGAGLTRIGLLVEDPSGKGLQQLAKTAGLLNKAGMKSKVTGNPLKYIWAKLFINVAINALTAIHRCPNGDLLTIPGAREIMEQAVSEAVAIAQELDIPVEGDPIDQAFQVCEATAGNISSMHQDVRNSKQTEIDAINGAIVALGKQLGVPSPVNAELVRKVKKVETAYLQ